MAYYAALVSLVQLLEEISHEDRYLNSVFDKEQISSLYEKFKLVQELLEDYSAKDHEEESNDLLQRRIRDVACKTQNIVESHIHSETREKRFFRHLFSASQKASQQLEDLEKVKAEVDSIVEELMRIKVRSQTIHEDLQLSLYISAESDGGASKVEAPSGRNTMVGFEEHLATVKAQLCGESFKREVISIVGMGGIGKTTLARTIFDDKLIHDSFDFRAWVNVSQDYHLRNILLAIVDSFNINMRELNEANEGVFVEHIYKHLKGRKYLVVMDDMWETKVWDDVRRVFPDDNNGSRVIITTRLLNVAVYAANSGFIHQLQLLDGDQSWELFCQKVLCPLELEHIGRLIANKCQGLPLALVVVAGLLSKVNKSKHDWEEIARNVSSVAIDQNGEHLSKILFLSYNHLPHHLKPCFLYFGGFPEDYSIHVSTLLRLWVAEGFLRPVESKSLEEVGEEYLKDLVNRNLIVITRKTSQGRFKYCSIHDLLRDLCLQRAHYENFIHCLHKKNDSPRELVAHECCRYIQIWKGSLFPKFKKEHVSHVRVVFLYDKDLVAPGYKLSRVLHARSMRSSEFRELLQLRYLALNYKTLSVHPSIFKLQNLQTLIVAGESSLSLPSEIWNMQNLRHIMIDEVTLAPPPIDGVPLLGRLQTLWRVINLKFTRDTIEMIPNLKKLKVRIYDQWYYENYWEMYDLKNLVHLHQLEKLEIHFSIFESSPGRGTFLLENFAFPLNLRKLSLSACRLPWKDMRAVGSLPYLQLLKLQYDAFFGEEWEPVEGEFLKLKFLVIDKLDDLKYWRVEDTHFPCLEQLQIIWCSKLEEIPSVIGDIPTLRLIKVSAGNSALESSLLRIQEEQLDLGNEDLQVHFVP